MPRHIQRFESENPYEVRHSRRPYSRRDTSREYDHDRGRRRDIYGDPDGPSRRYRRQNGLEGGRKQTHGRNRGRRSERDRVRIRPPRATHAHRPRHSPGPSCLGIGRSCLKGDDDGDDHDPHRRPRPRRHPATRRAKPQPTTPESRPRSRPRRRSPDQSSYYAGHYQRQARPPHDNRPARGANYSRSGPTAKVPPDRRGNANTKANAGTRPRQPRPNTKADPKSSPPTKPESNFKSRAQKAAQYAAFGNAVRVGLQSGAQAAYKLRNHPSPWLGEKGLRVAAAAIVPGIVNGYLASRESAAPSTSGSRKADDNRREGLRQAVEAGIRNFVQKTGGDGDESHKRKR